MKILGAQTEYSNSPLSKRDERDAARGAGVCLKRVRFQTARELLALRFRNPRIPNATPAEVEAQAVASNFKSEPAGALGPHIWGVRFPLESGTFAVEPWGSAEIQNRPGLTPNTLKFVRNVH